MGGVRAGIRCRQSSRCIRLRHTAGNRGTRAGKDVRPETAASRAGRSSRGGSAVADDDLAEPMLEWVDAPVRLRQLSAYPGSGKGSGTARVHGHCKQRQPGGHPFRRFQRLLRTGGLLA